MYFKLSWTLNWTKEFCIVQMLIYNWTILHASWTINVSTVISWTLNWTMWWFLKNVDFDLNYVWTLCLCSWTSWLCTKNHDSLTTNKLNYSFFYRREKSISTRTIPGYSSTSGMCTVFFIYDSLTTNWTIFFFLRRVASSIYSNDITGHSWTSCNTWWPRLRWVTGKRF